MQKSWIMWFEKIIDDGRLWAVKYDEKQENAFSEVFGQWNDYEWLENFFSENLEDLSSYFHITDIDKAIFDTVDDAYALECLIMDLSPETRLDDLFRPLENTRASEVILGREKAKGTNHTHASWLRLYAIRLESGRYIITGGALKLTATMQEREHTLAELIKLNQVRDFLIEQGVFDIEGLNELSNEDK